MNKITLMLICTLCMSIFSEWGITAETTDAMARRPGEFVVTQKILRPTEKVPPLGVNGWGGCGAIEYAANNLVSNSGNEPVYWKNLHRIMKVDGRRIEIDGPGTSWWDLWGNGFLSGSKVRIYRIVDPNGNVLPTRENGEPDLGSDPSNVQVKLVGETTIVAPGVETAIPDGGWVATKYTEVNKIAHLSSQTRRCVDELAITNDRTYWYVMTAVAADGTESEYSMEVSATPQSGLKKATDADRVQSVDLPKTEKKELETKPEPPQNIRAVAGDQCVFLEWDASPSDVVEYRVRRSISPKSQQDSCVYLEKDFTDVLPWDYMVIEKKFDPFDMRLVNTRVLGIGNPIDRPDWYWNADDKEKVRFSLDSYEQNPAPKEMFDPGESSMRIDLSDGFHSINQVVFVGLDKGGESLWYGQLEPEIPYQMEVWMRQEGLDKNGQVTFSYGSRYPEIHQSFQVSNKWQKYTYNFTGPEWILDTWHFGHELAATGPGTLWIDNMRIFRTDVVESPLSRDDMNAYIPHPRVLNELLTSQPDHGKKGAHRIWFLTRDTTMSSILGMSANSKVNVDWRTNIEGTMRMTLPMGLEFDRATGNSPENRMRPWLVMQHILHSEKDWQNFIEYLAAPYDPKQDTPEKKPWAYRRFLQRNGNSKPWTDEFSQITIEFGNETWHNGVFADWLGFKTNGAVTQGGFEYGLFTRYLIEKMKDSPYWKSQNLDEKIRFSLGAFYNGNVETDGKITGYGEEAMQTNPLATALGHATYVGPKWETGEYSSRNYDDHGVQECLLSFLAASQKNQAKMTRAQEAMSQQFHPYDIVAYEAGPGGYALPGQASAEQVEVNENYGKSLAQSVAVMDSWMYGYLGGWTDQCFFNFGQGNHWSSHTNFFTGYRPSIAWLTVTLRNRFASGDLVQVNTMSVPEITRMENETETLYPLMDVYAFHDQNTHIWSIIVVSRKLDGNHDGVDWGNGYTPVAITLPFDQAKKVTLHRLTGDPRWTNRDEQKVTIETLEIPTRKFPNGVFKIEENTGGTTDGMPPGSIYLYQFK